MHNPELNLAADILDDIEKVRIANANRLQIMTRDTEDVDGEIRGWGLSEDDPAVVTVMSMVSEFNKLEAQAEKYLTKVMKSHPLGKWAKTQKGLGDKQAARLLAAIGDPYWHDLENRPRTVSELWAYSGLHVWGVEGKEISEPGGGVAPKRKKGVKANWSSKAKMRAYLIAESCTKQLKKPCEKIDGEVAAKHVEGCICSPYRVIYDERRARTSVTHPEWTLMHAKNDALRIVSKEILKAFYNASKELHEKSK